MENGPACCCVFITLKGPGFNNAWLHGTSNIPVFQLGGEEEEVGGGGEARRGEAKRGEAAPSPGRARKGPPALHYPIECESSILFICPPGGGILVKAHFFTSMAVASETQSS